MSSSFCPNLMMTLCADTRCFVRQLRMIDLPRHLIRQAIHNFYRADKLRTWLVDELHLEELDEYDLQLKEESTTYFYSILVSEGDEQTYQQFGQSIYNRIQQEVDIPIHPQFTKKYVTRGSYQILADREPPEIGWHPKFKEYFEQPYSDFVNTMLNWENRPVEITHLLNPAFCAVLLHDSTRAYVEIINPGISYPLMFVILPLILHKATREEFPKTLKLPCKNGTGLIQISIYHFRTDSAASTLHERSVDFWVSARCFFSR